MRSFEGQLDSVKMEHQDKQSHRPKADPLNAPKLITSSRNPLIREVLRLRDNRQRQRSGSVLVDGNREVARAISGGLKLRSLLTSDPPPVGDLERGPTDAESTSTLIAYAGATAVQVTPELMRKIAYGENPRGAIAVFDRPDKSTLGKLPLPENPLVVILVGVEKPGNIGAIIRSADAVAADAVIFCDTPCDRFNPNLIRSSLGTIFTLPSAEATQAETIAWLESRGIHPFCTFVGAPCSLWEADYRGPTAIVLGPESTCLGEIWKPQPDRPSTIDGIRGGTSIGIPMQGMADSLNVSVAAAVILFEAARQRKQTA